RGQSSCLTLPWRGCARAGHDFHEAHEAQFGYRLKTPVELVNLKVSLSCAHEPPAIPMIEPSVTATHIGVTRLHGMEAHVKIYRRGELQSGQRIQGPILVVEETATTFVAQGWICVIDEYGNLNLLKPGRQTKVNGRS